MLEKSFFLPLNPLQERNRRRKTMLSQKKKTPNFDAINSSKP